MSKEQESQECVFQPKVAIIVLNWNGKKNTCECLDSLSRLDYKNFEIIVVDNGSTDGSQSLLKNYSKIILVENSRNLGFGGGLNSGIREAIKRTPDYFLCLNNDVIVDKNMLSELVKIGESNSRIGGLCPLECDYSQPNRIICAGGVIKFAKGKLFGHGELDTGQFDKVLTTGLLSGPAMMLKSTALSVVGLLDTSYFYGPEDQDVALRIIRKGFDLAFVPSAKLWHKRRGATRGKITPLNEYFRTRNFLLFAKKNANSVELFFSVLYFGFFYFPMTLVKNVYSGRWLHLKATLNGILWHFDSRLLLPDSQMVGLLYNYSGQKEELKGND